MYCITLSVMTAISYGAVCIPRVCRHVMNWEAAIIHPTAAAVRRRIGLCPSRVIESLKESKSSVTAAPQVLQRAVNNLATLAYRSLVKVKFIATRLSTVMSYFLLSSQPFRMHTAHVARAHCFIPSMSPGQNSTEHELLNKVIEQILGCTAVS